MLCYAGNIFFIGRMEGDMIQSADSFGTFPKITLFNPVQLEYWISEWTRQRHRHIYYVTVLVARDHATFSMDIYMVYKWHLDVNLFIYSLMDISYIPLQIPPHDRIHSSLMEISLKALTHTSSLNPSALPY
jgi:hypothetical protein